MAISSQEFLDTVHLAKEVGGTTKATTPGRFPMERKSQRKIMQRRLYRDVRVAAETEYRKRRVNATNGTYDEASASAKLGGMPRFTTQEIYCGDKLGNGAFGSVYEVLNIRIMDQDDVVETNHAAKSFMAQHCLRDYASDEENTARPTRDARYAIKKLRSQIIKGDKETFAQAMLDVATETRILASIPHHPNIIKLRGIASSGGSNANGCVSAFPACCFHEEYFLVLDRLYGTLEDRLHHWTEQDDSIPKTRGFREMLWCGQRQKQQQQQLQQRKKGHVQERLLACLDLASALAHLHKHNIIHRDIKPPNIGFNIRGDLTVFDFGLSRELPKPNSSNKNKNKANSSKLFRMTGFCGSPRYMAPEVGLRKVYNAKCDVYSFGLLAWQILTLQKPYGGCDTCDLKYIVWPGTKGVVGPGDWTENLANSGRFHQFGSYSNRNNAKKSSKPKAISRSLPDLAKMIDRTFRRNIAARPTMKELEEFLRTAVEGENINENETNSRFRLSPVREHSRRRSTFVFRPPLSEMQQQNRPKKIHTGRRSSVPAAPPTQRVQQLLQQHRSLEDTTYHGTDIKITVSTH